MWSELFKRIKILLLCESHDQIEINRKCTRIRRKDLESPEIAHQRVSCGSMLFLLEDLLSDR